MKGITTALGACISAYAGKIQQIMLYGLYNVLV